MSLTSWEYREARTPKASVDLARLNDKQRAILAALVYGLDEDNGKPIRSREVSVNELADHFNVRRRYIRDLLLQPIVKAEMASMIAAKRLGLVPKAINVLDNAMHSDNEAAAVKAALGVLGETAKAAAVTVNVNQQTAVIGGDTIRPGYVIKLPADIVDATD